MTIWSKLWMVVDTETTGADPALAEVCELGFRFFQNGEPEKERYGRLLNPGCHIPSEASAVHGITDEMVADKPSFLEVKDNFLKHVARAEVIVAYNGYEYDFPIISRICEENWSEGKTLIDPLVLVFAIAKAEFWKGKGTKKLSSVCKRYGITVSGSAHRTGADCEMTGKLLWYLSEHRDDVLEQILDMDLDPEEMEKTLRRIKAKQDREFAAWKSRQN